MADLHCVKVLPIFKKKIHSDYYSRQTDTDVTHPALKIKNRKTIALMTKGAVAHCADGK